MILANTRFCLLLTKLSSTLFVLHEKGWRFVSNYNKTYSAC